ncbi:MAG: formylglycine-generating enzyme family protein, partial [Gammaproteobacteria bacterium]|nr:formylglycine-generating enzyme family protein [Gammaproteobacteria bacterium]
MAFIDAMRREHLHVVDRHYRYDPRLSRSAYDPGQGRGPAMLITLYPDHDLLLSGEGEALADPTRTDLSPWTDIFDWWPRKWLLSPAPLWPRVGFFQRLAKAGFRAGALTTAGLAQLQDERIQVAEDDPYDLPLPARLGRDPLRWLQSQGITRKQARSIVDELWRYLGRAGFLLLAAAASYPELRWPLTRALDLQLGFDLATREWRLRKLARLPWFRYAYIPDVIRYAIFARLPKGDIRRLSDAFEALFQHQGDRPLHLPVAIPDWQAQKGAIARATRSAPPGTPLADRVLAAVIRGRRPRQLEFALPFNRLNQQVAQDWRALGLPLLIGALLLPAALWLNLWFWQAGADAWVRDSALARMRSAGAEVQVEIHYLTQTQAYALSLEAELKNRGFSRIALQAAAPPPARQKGRDEPVNQIEHGELGPGILLSAVRAGIDYITYGAEVNVEKSASLASDRVRLSLLTVPKGFQDALGGLGPAMVSIPGGCFEMGSPADEPERIDNERQHRVCVEPFMLSRYEVTFAEYDAFPEATKRKKPNDQGWGRGRRPVINVSWEDATAYAAWLSEETGTTYRLPTEAEWEYAARAGTTTPFHFGEQISTEQANFNGNYTYNGSAKGEYRQQTLAVGQFEANGFGLYDVHGNVREWTCST